MDNFDNIKKILTSTFEVDLFDASLASLNDQTNKLRYNNFAYSIRELSRHFLYSLSPEVNIKKCAWFKIETKDDKTTRAQRIKYAIQGGVTDDVLKKWGFDTDQLKKNIRRLLNTIDSLSKYTHINPDVFDLDKIDILTKSTDVLNAFKIFVETIDEYRGKLKSFLDEHIEEHMVVSIVSEYFENIDSLAPHYSLDDCEVTDYNVLQITDCEIIVFITGIISVTLLYGSNQERREGDGHDIEQSFPFETSIRYEISEDFPLGHYDIDDYGIDTSESFGEDR